MFEEAIHCLPRILAAAAAVFCINAVSAQFRPERPAVSVKKKLMILLSALAVIILAVTVRELILRRADYHNGSLRFDGKTYEEVSSREIGPFTETWNTLCRTRDGRWSVYELDSFPGLEYVAARMGHEARILKLVSK